MNESNTLVADDSPGLRGRLDKRAAILDAAYRVFAREGYERASVDLIAAEAGVAKPTIYNHFGGKEELFRRVIVDSAKHVNAATIAAIETFPLKSDDLDDDFRLIGEKMVGCLQDPKMMTLQRLLWAEVGHFPDLFDDVLEHNARPVIESLAGRLAILANAGYLEIENPIRAANQFMALISDELRTLTALGTKTIEPEVWRESVNAGVRTFLRAYAKR